jgi:hypothetical protein
MADASARPTDRVRGRPHPSFWLACSLIFGVNAVISAWGGHWVLTGLGAVTSAMAAVATVVSVREQPRGG